MAMNHSLLSLFWAWLIAWFLVLSGKGHVASCHEALFLMVFNVFLKTIILFKYINFILNINFKVLKMQIIVTYIITHTHTQISLVLTTVSMSLILL